MFENGFISFDFCGRILFFVFPAQVQIILQYNRLMGIFKYYPFYTRIFNLFLVLARFLPCSEVNGMTNVFRFFKDFHHAV